MRVNKINLDYLYLSKGDVVLDLGCSSGTQAIEIAKQDLTVYALDSSQKLIKELIKSIKNKKIKCIPILGDAKKIPFEDNKFDAVILTEVLEHIPNNKKVIKEVYRILRPGGRICISIPTEVSEFILRLIHPQWIEYSGHINNLSKKKLISMLQIAGFKVDRIEKNNFEWFGFWLLHSLFKTKFDFTGKPLENNWLTSKYNLLWNKLFRLKIARYVLYIGNIIFPKSYYLYAHKNKS